MEPGDAVSGPNRVLGIVEQVVYRGYVSHIYLRLDNGEPLIAFQSASDRGPPPGPGTRVVARWSAASNRVVHDEPSG